MQLKQFGKHFFNHDIAATIRASTAFWGAAGDRSGYDKAARRGWGVPGGSAVSEIQTAGDYCPWP